MRSFHEFRVSVECIAIERVGDEPGDEPPTGGAPDEPGKLLLSNSIMWELEPVGGSRSKDGGTG